MLARRVMLQCRQMANNAKTGSMTGAHAIAIGSGLIGAGGLAYSLKHAFAPAETAMLNGVAMWPQYVRERLQGTFGYFGAGVGFCGLGGAAACRIPAVLNFFSRGGFMSFGVALALMMGSSAVAHSIPFDGNQFGGKALAYYTHMAIVGAVISPILYHAAGAGVLARAGGATLAIMGSLAMTGMVAPSDAYVKTYGAVNAGCFLMLGACAASFFAPPMSGFALGLESFIMLGGLALFSVKGFSDLQRCVAQAQMPGQFDPINHANAITHDAINIFIRLALMMSNNKRK